MANLTDRQRTGFIKLLTEAKQKLEESIGSYRLPDIPKGDEEQLRKKYNLDELEAAKDKAEAAWDAAHGRFSTELKAAQRVVLENEKASVQAITSAIKDVLAAETVEEAKAIVEPYIGKGA